MSSINIIANQEPYYSKNQGEVFIIKNNCLNFYLPPSIELNTIATVINDENNTVKVKTYSGSEYALPKYCTARFFYSNVVGIAGWELIDIKCPYILSAPNQFSTNVLPLKTYSNNQAGTVETFSNVIPSTINVVLITFSIYTTNFTVFENISVIFRKVGDEIQTTFIGNSQATNNVFNGSALLRVNEITNNNITFSTTMVGNVTGVGIKVNY